MLRPIVSSTTHPDGPARQVKYSCLVVTPLVEVSVSHKWKTFRILLVARRKMGQVHYFAVPASVAAKHEQDGSMRQIYTAYPLHV